MEGRKSSPLANFDSTLTIGVVAQGPDLSLFESYQMIGYMNRSVLPVAI